MCDHAVHPANTCKPLLSQRPHFENNHHMPCLPTSARYLSVCDLKPLRQNGHAQYGETQASLSPTEVCCSSTVHRRLASWLGGLFHGIVRDLLSWSSAKRGRKRRADHVVDLEVSGRYCHRQIRGFVVYARFSYTETTHGLVYSEQFLHIVWWWSCKEEKNLGPRSPRMVLLRAGVRASLI